MKLAKLNTPILCLPFFGPWEGGTFSDAMNLALNIKPRFIIPIHDYHYKPEFKDSFYLRAQNAIKSFDSKLICKSDGAPESLEL